MTAKKIVVVGSGAREHALVRALLRGAAAPGAAEREVVAIPGNPGIALEARCVSCASDVASLARTVLAERPALVVVGPEAPLAAGLADRLHAAGLAVFGPTAAAAQIEASKSFAKDVMRAASVPTPASELFTEREAARAYAGKLGPCVVKLDGLAAGKGVIVCDSAAQAERAIDELWPPGAAGPAVKILVEEKIEGPELSVIALCDGERFLVLPAARDHKRLLEGDRGPNTGGMGAVSPPRDATPALLEEVARTVLQPTLREMQRRGTPFRGALFAGLMLTKSGVRVLEFNCRLGDPEAQAILMRLRGDVLPLFDACARGTLTPAHALDVDPRAAVGVVLAAHGYPAAPRAGDAIAGLELAQSESLAIFHAGTRRDGASIVTAGGRVLTLCALGRDVREARAHAYAAAETVTFAGRQLRRDIAASEI